jgi:type VI secretion system protein ImpH
MAAAGGRENPGLSGQLLREGHRFDFFQAVRLLERVFRERARDDARWLRHPVGYDRPPEREVVRFRAATALSFPASDVAGVRAPAAPPGAADAEAAPPEMAVNFFGLTGPGGVLPLHYAALLLRRVRLRDYALRDFLDLFNHRLVSLFYRAGEKYRLPLSYERSKAEGADAAPATHAVFCLAGFGTPGLLGRQAVDDEAFLYYSGHFTHVPRSALALECLLEDYFGLPLDVLQFQGQYLYLGPEERSYAPGNGFPDGRNFQLGVSLVAGERCWDVQSKFRIRVGPLDYATFRSLMPNGDTLKPLQQMTRTFVGLEFDFDVQLVLRWDEVPWCRLGSQRDPPRLGWNTWVRCKPFAREVDDAVFQSGDL